MILDRLTWVESGTTRGTRGDPWLKLFDANSKSEAEGLLGEMVEKVRDGPRDLLYWLERALHEAQSQRRTLIKRIDIEQARRKSASRSFKEMQAAHSTRYPKIGEVVKIVFRQRRKRFSMQELRRHILDLRVKDRDMQRFSGLGWMQQETAETLPQRFFEIGALTFEVGNQRFLPYMPGYDVDNLGRAEKVFLAPLLQEA